MSIRRRTYSRIPTRRMEAEEQSVLMSGNAAVKISEEERAWTHRDIPESDILPIDDLREYSQRQKIQRAIRQSERQRADKSRKPRIRYISKYRRCTLKDREERRNKAHESELAAIEAKKAAIEEEIRLKKEQKRRELQEKRRRERELKEQLERELRERERLERELKEKERLEQELREKERIKRELEERKRLEQERLENKIEEQKNAEQAGEELKKQESPEKEIKEQDSQVHDDIKKEADGQEALVSSEDIGTADSENEADKNEPDAQTSDASVDKKDETGNEDHSENGINKEPEGVDEEETQTETPEAAKEENADNDTPANPEPDNIGENDAADAAESAEGRTKDGKKTRAVIGGVAAAAAIAYGGGVFYYQSHFLPNTFESGINLGGMTAEAADASLKGTVLDSMEVVSVRGSEVLDLSGVNAVKHFNPSLEGIKAQNAFMWPAAFFGNREAEIGFSASYDVWKLSDAVDGLKLIDTQPEDIARDAYISADLETGIYEIVPENTGFDIDVSKLKREIRNALDNGIVSLNIENSDVYHRPSVTAEDEELKAKAAFMNELNEANVYLDLGAGMNNRLTGEELSGMINRDGTVNENGVRTFVSELAKAYDTCSPEGERTIINHAGVNKTFKSDYGWKLDQEETVNAIIEGLNQHLAGNNAGSEAASSKTEVLDEDISEIFETVDMEAVWDKKAAMHGDRDYGYSYIEIDMGEQKVYAYVDGVCVLETPCVTGKMTADRMTPEGLYSIRAKQRNRVLVGYKPDGSIDYRSPVKFWMPFNGGIGLHDASWRSEFGGELYVNGGSHGCINLPREAAQKIYDLCYKDMPVICYY